MNLKTLVLAFLILIPTSSFAVDDYLKHKPVIIPSASLARAEAEAVTKIQIANEIPLLRKTVAESIAETADNGYTMTNPDVTKYHVESVHVVAVELRQKGYYVEYVTGFCLSSCQLLVIDWSKGK